jgi:AcrR family transcriptional regulator
MNQAQPRKDRDWEDRRNLLLEAAGRVFGRKPYGEASMQEIAEEARIDLDGFYRHFASKQALYEELATSRSRSLLEEAERLAEAGLAPEEELRTLTYALVSHFNDHPNALPLFLHTRFLADWGMESRLSATQDLYATGRLQLQQCLRRMVASGRLRPWPLELLTELYLDVLQACLQFHYRHFSEEEGSGCVERVLDCFLHGAGDQP